MSALKFISEIAAPHTTVLVTGTHQPISAEVVTLLRSIGAMEVLEISDANVASLPESQTNIVIHFAGFDLPSLSQTLYHTSTLHRLIDFSLQQNSKLILVLPEKETHEQQIAISLVRQFGKNFSLNYLILTIPEKVDMHDAAVEVVRSFVHKFVEEPLKKVESIVEHKIPEIIFTHPSTDKKSSVARIIISAILITLLALLLEVGLMAGSLYCAYLGVVSTRQQVVQNCAHTAKFMAEVLTWQTKLIGQNQLFVAGSRAADTLTILGQIQYLISQNQWIEAGKLLPQASEGLAYLQADLVWPNHSDNLMADIQSTRETIGKLQTIWPTLAEVANSPQQKWLVLLQDANELRPSGGFLEKYALVTLAKGQITNVQFFDTENSDSLLRGQVEPPTDLKLTTHQNNWYLRDGNWDPDFNISAEKTAWFVGKEIGQYVDGVVALNSLWLHDIASAIGDQQLKFDIATIEKLRKLNTTQKNKIWQEVVNGLNNRQILLHKLDNNRAINATGWGGESGGQTDSIYFVNSNIGVNKVNPFIDEDYQLSVSMGDQKIDYSFKLNYTNTSASTSYPEGDYVNYVRPVLSSSIKIDSIQIENGAAVSASAAGFLLTVPVGQSRHVIIKAHQSVATNPESYSLKWFNQPGLKAVPVNVVVSPGIASQPELRYNALLTKPFILVASLKANGQ